ncbi:hypothetical protein ETA_09490 [Erwinia tasmaniensis Et1/99]|uniref:Uncharacterized protein n=1 Tax=Erwinia tasmaniensis (strain DSM 17950 / CFBP 7177 / CIP 109463 / NCPPB 4357 / Et1/99) TaxID=465817 RepID=B2VDV8_ERWT9|nr:hypothetical protein ETA_09490 [Erwinia tasmaniensis Et1/99]
MTGDDRQATNQFRGCVASSCMGVSRCVNQIVLPSCFFPFQFFNNSSIFIDKRQSMPGRYRGGVLR